MRLGGEGREVETVDTIAAREVDERPTPSLPTKGGGEGIVLSDECCFVGGGEFAAALLAG